MSKCTLEHLGKFIKSVENTALLLSLAEDNEMCIRIVLSIFRHFLPCPFTTQASIVSLELKNSCFQKYHLRWIYFQTAISCSLKMSVPLKVK